MSRAATFADFYGHEEDCPGPSVPDNGPVVRKNVEYGAKKFIKP